MTESGFTIENPVTRERLTWLKTSNDTGGEYLRFELFVKSGGGSPIPHVHMRQSEGIEVVSGTMLFRAGKGRAREVHAGERVYIPSGVPHVWRNHEDEELRLAIEFRPAMNTETLIETLWGLARDGRMRAGKGVPSIFQRAVWFAGTYKGENYLESPPIPVQKFLFALLAPIGKRLGYKDWYPEYTDPSDLPGRRRTQIVEPPVVSEAPGNVAAMEGRIEGNSAPPGARQ